MNGKLTKARKTLALIAVALSAGVLWQVIHFIWFGNAIVDLLIALLFLVGAAAAGRWAEYLFDLEEPTDAGE